MTIREFYGHAFGPTLRNYAWFLVGLASIVAVWLFVEWVVILSPLAGNRAIWCVMHLGYFFLTAIPESALIRVADNVATCREPLFRIRPDLLTVVR